MTALVWDQVGDRVYENGLEKGVLYLSDGSGVAWNGLTNVDSGAKISVTPVYFDGAKVNDIVTLGDFEGKLTAFTYPDEFLEYQGFGEVRDGVYLDNQPLKTFGLCYRTNVNNDVDGTSGYKIHILYNLTAVPSSQAYSTLSDNSDAIEFEWELSAVPEERDGRRPSAHVILDSRTIGADLLEEIESLLYGTDLTPPTLLSFSNVMDYLEFLVVIIDHGDGTWSAITQRDGFITDDGTGDGEFTIDNVNATYLDADTYEISNTLT